MKLFNYFIALIAVISVILNIKLLHDRQNPNEATYKVLEVIDGDTFKVEAGSGERRVRLMAVNAPEAGKCLSDEAREKLSSLVLGKKIVLKDQFSDPYGRIISNVYVGNVYVNREMLRLGLGRMDYYENPQREELKEAYGEARAKKLGIYSGVCLSKSPSSACSIKGNIDGNTRKKIYFLPACRNYSQVTIDLSTDDTWFCTEAEAVRAGFVKSQTCN
ncbi:MAG: nuclease [Candidatus Gottesmanbacteria bacterium GW2011_GWA2_43_14]|uniref:Nuclease n=1 Tax=Candidatus Gottesmanbacteria bacterium GW2011_GWA2_43_14 TaxID=1618443 RepID=A0A0G1DJK3_9BACT|nr:MAG: nuclease [Candidatus Gottesmanbacteria bacterium GW2011_GWA2_43_14]